MGKPRVWVSCKHDLASHVACPLQTAEHCMHSGPCGLYHSHTGAVHCVGRTVTALNCVNRFKPWASGSGWAGLLSWGWCDGRHRCGRVGEELSVLHKL